MNETESSSCMFCELPKTFLPSISVKGALTWLVAPVDVAKTETSPRHTHATKKSSKKDSWKHVGKLEGDIGGKRSFYKGK